MEYNKIVQHNIDIFKYTVGENIIATTKIRNNYGAIQTFKSVAIVERAITIWKAIQKRNHDDDEPIFKTHTKIEAKG